MYHGEQRVIYGVIASAIILIGLLVVGMILSGKSSSLSSGVVIVTATPLPPTVQTSAAPLMSVCLVPEVVGQDQGAAEGLIAGAGLQPVKSTTYDPNIPAGGVISQDPPSGTKINPCQGDVTIIVSLGAVPQPTNTPEPPTNTPEPPTNTPEPPTNTPEPPTNTPDTLKPGETSIQDGMELKLDIMNIESPQRIYVHFSLVNNTQKEVLLKYDLFHYSARDNSGKDLQITEERCPPVNIIFRAGDVDVCGFYIDTDLSKISQIIIVTSDISRIKQAKWHIPIDLR